MEKVEQGDGLKIENNKKNDVLKQKEKKIQSKKIQTSDDVDLSVEKVQELKIQNSDFTNLKVNVT